jgi:hypothetical protein
MRRALERKSNTELHRMAGSSRSRHLHSAGKIWTELGLLGSLLAGGVLFIHVPAELWVGNIPEFTFGFIPFFALGLAFLLAGLLTTFLALRLLPQSARPAMACSLGAVGLIWWCYGMIFVGHMRVLNGIDAPMEFDTAVGAWELLLVAAGVLVLAGGSRKRPRLGRQLLLVLNGILAATTTVSLATAPRTAIRGDPTDVFKFSPKQNVLAVLFDGLQSDVADRVLRQDPVLAGQFEGFRLFKDTLAVAPTTFLNMPAIHSGEDYHRQRALGTHFTDSIERHSFMNRFARAGYETTLVYPIEGICPARVTSCIATADPRSSWARLKSEAIRLFDLSLFRVSPVWVKRRIYADGQWLFAGQFDRPDETTRIIQGNRFLTDISRRIVVAGDTPTIKLLHIVSTHTPYVLEDDCRTIGESTLSHLDSQAHCALLAIGAVLGSLKDKGIYDNTVVLIFADHGVNPGVYGDPASDAFARFRHRAGAANPVFLLKPLRSRGTLIDAPGAVYVGDVGATLCAASGACDVPIGFPAGSAPVGRPRRFSDYQSGQGFWEQRDIPGITRYEIRGPVWEADSWHRVD